MKTRYYIASIIVSTFLFSACQKSEFAELMDEPASRVEAREAQDDAAGEPDGVAQVDGAELPVIVTPVKSGVVKEVSDGDDESDDDETSKK